MPDHADQNPMTPDDLSGWLFNELGKPARKKDGPDVRYARLRLLLEAGANPDWTTGPSGNPFGGKGWTLISKAAAIADAPAVKMLAQYGVNVNTADGNGMPPLLQALTCRSATPQDMKTTAVTLLHLGADANAADRNKAVAEVPLIRAACLDMPDMIQALLDAGAHIDEQNMYGQTALALAVLNRKTACVKALLTAGANVRWQHKTDSKSLQDIACAALPEGHEIRLMLAGISAPAVTPALPPVSPAGFPPVAALDRDRLAAWMYEEISQHAETTSEKKRRYMRVKFLLDAGANPAWDVEKQYVAWDKHTTFSPAAEAARTHDAALIKLLADYGMDFNVSDQNGISPMLHAIKCPAKNPAHLNETITTILNITQKNTGADQTLFYAAHNGYPDMVDLLLKAGAQADTPNAHGKTPLATAVLQGYAAIVKILLDAGASSQWHDPSDGKSLLAITRHYENGTDAQRDIYARLQQRLAADNINKLKEKRPPKPFGPK